MKLSQRIKLGFAVPLAIIVTLGCLSIYQASQVDSSMKDCDSSAVLALAAKDLKLNVVQVQQWLTDISATGGENGLNDGFDEAAVNAKAFREGMGRFRQIYEHENVTDQLTRVDNISRRFEAYYEMGQKMANAYISDGRGAGNKLMEEFDPFAAALTDELEPFVEQQLEQFRRNMQSVVNQSKSMLWVVGIAVAFATLLSQVVSWLITGSIVGPLSRVIQNLTAGSHQVASAAAEISRTSQELAQGASQQAASLEETSASLEEITQMVKNNGDNTREANAMASEMETATGNSVESMTQMRQAIGEISASADATAKIVRTIDDIAFQTNLLALNAAVEAARAGDAGRGFSVVAEEVRALAQRSASAARDTSALIQQSQTNAQNGVNSSTEVETALKDIAERNKKITVLMNEVHSASDEQTRGVEQISASITNMDRVTQGSAAVAEESAAAAEELNAQSNELLQVVSQLAEMVYGREAVD